MSDKKQFVVSRNLACGQNIIVEANNADDAVSIARDIEDTEWETSDSFVCDNHYDVQEVLR